MGELGTKREGPRRPVIQRPGVTKSVSQVSTRNPHDLSVRYDWRWSPHSSLDLYCRRGTTPHWNLGVSRDPLPDDNRGKMTTPRPEVYNSVNGFRCVDHLYCDVTWCVGPWGLEGGRLRPPQVSELGSCSRSEPTPLTFLTFNPQTKNSGRDRD